MKFVSHSQALEYVQREAGLSRETFDLNIRPRLIERKYTDRVIRFSRIALKQAVVDPTFKEEAMLRRKKTVGDALEHAWKVKWRDDKGSHQKENLKEQVDDDIGHWKLPVKYPQVQQWILDMRERRHGKKRKRYAIASIGMRVSCLYTALELVRREGWITHVPDRPPLPGKARRERYLTPEEEQALCAKIESMKWPSSRRLMPSVLAFLIDTGCRRSELLKVRGTDITDDGVIFRDRKASNSIKVPLTARARKGINFLLADPSWQRRIEGTLDSKARCRNTGNWLSQEFSKLCKLAKVDGVSIHTCRHTCGSRLVQRGMDLFRVQKWLGHRDISSTQIYAHLQPTDLESGAKLLESFGSDNIVDFHERRIRDD